MMLFMMFVAGAMAGGHSWIDRSTEGVACSKILRRDGRNVIKSQKYDASFPETWVTSYGLGSGSAYAAGKKGRSTTLELAKKRCEQICDCTAIMAPHDRAWGQCVGHKYVSTIDGWVKNQYDMLDASNESEWRVCADDTSDLWVGYPTWNLKASCFFAIDRDESLPCDNTRSTEAPAETSDPPSLSPSFPPSTSPSFPPTYSPSYAPTDMPVDPCAQFNSKVSCEAEMCLWDRKTRNLKRKYKNKLNAWKRNKIRQNKTAAALVTWLSQNPEPVKPTGANCIGLSCSSLDKGKCNKHVRCLARADGTCQSASDSFVCADLHKKECKKAPGCDYVGGKVKMCEDK